MAASIVGGVGCLGGFGWQPAKRDKEGHRDYTLSTLVKSNYLDGAKVVMDCPGLPAIGSVWNVGNDTDAWAFCWPEMTVTPVGRKQQDRNEFWRVDQKFSTRPLKRCQNSSIENPLQEPQDISGTFAPHLKAITQDRYGSPLKNSSHEPLTGPLVEFNDSRPTVHIEQNVGSLQLTTLAQYRDCVNDRTMWGLPPRTILLTNISWRRLLWGICTYYYRRIFDFEIDYTTHDRKAPNYGTMVRRGSWSHSTDPPSWNRDINADSDNPRHFIRFTDANGHPARVYLDPEGDPVHTGAVTGTGTGTTSAVNFIDIEHYEEKNLLNLGIPSIIG